jgi:hypothetical protein
MNKEVLKRPVKPIKTLTLYAITVGWANTSEFNCKIFTHLPTKEEKDRISYYDWARGCRMQRNWCVFELTVVEKTYEVLEILEISEIENSQKIAIKSIAIGTGRYLKIGDRVPGRVY